MVTPIKKILVATDFSPDAERATLVAIELSRAYLAPLTLLHVYDPTAYPQPDGYLPFTPAQLDLMWEGYEQRLSQRCVEAKMAGAIRAESRVLQGLTATEIVRCAREGGFDLIVLGTHGRRGLARAVLGSVAERVVQTADCPVLAVKAQARSAEAREEGPALSRAAG